MKGSYVDLFAGAGGLGEGFQQALFDPVYINDIDISAIKTCQLRKAYHKLLELNRVDLYYKFIHSSNKNKPSFYDPSTFITDDKDLCHIIDKISSTEVMSKDNISFHYKKIKSNLNEKNYSDLDVIAGGPPCQAYSYGARSRLSKTNDSKRGSKKQNIERRKKLRYDKRHQLYELYLELIKKCRPKVFVYENVPGLLTAKSKKENAPGAPSYVINRFKNDFISIGDNYEIVPLIEIKLGLSSKLNFRDFIVDAADYGVPQNRKRFIMVGFRKDIVRDNNAIEKFWNEVQQKRITSSYCVKDAIFDLPHIKSNSGSEQYSIKRSEPGQSSYSTLMTDKRLNIVLNHTSRSHMSEDLKRYEWYSKFGLKNDVNATLKDLPLNLYPNHQSAKNILKNKKNKPVHIDRFKVQLWNKPSNTITAHISKDGHSYIHPDPKQNRSLTVREVARLQSFPDNYVFCGPRTHQYKQIGNAVPPILANVIATSIKKAIQ